MIYLGEYNRLKIQRLTPVGMYLADKIGNEVLLPRKYIEPHFKVGELVDVFVYKDQQDRPVATTIEPALTLGGFAYLKVRDITPHGAFMIWGPEKDLLVPFAEQHERMESGHSYVVHLFLDEKTHRLTGSGKILSFLHNEDHQLQQGDSVEALIFSQSPLGYNAIIFPHHLGLIYHTDVFQPIAIGDTVQAFILKIREDFRIDLRLQPEGEQGRKDSQDKVYQYLQVHGGFLPLHDGSSPDEVYSLLKMSKKAFKRSTGMLYKQRLISITPEGIHLLKKDTSAESTLPR